MTERKTDLAMEVRESFPRDNVEIKGVVLEKKRDEKSGAKITVVERQQSHEKAEGYVYYDRIGRTSA